MEYDFVALSTAIATASASIAAIIGGFLASKVISLGADRTKLDFELSSINQEIDFHSSEIRKRKAEIDEEDALSYITENASALFDGKKLEEVYECTTAPDIAFADLKPFWERAEKINKLYCLHLRDEKVEKEPCNTNGIPMNYIDEFKDNFEAEVWNILEGQTTRVFNSGYFDVETPPFPRVSGLWYRDAIKEKEKHETDLKLLELRKEQIINERASLKKPKGLHWGYLVFGLFVSFCIVLPLVFIMINPDNYSKYGHFEISAFVLGLAAIFLYLRMLMKDRQQL